MRDVKWLKFWGWTRFWLAWCVVFFLFDTVVGAVYLTRGEWGRAIYEFAFAAIMALFFRLYLRDYRDEQRAKAEDDFRYTFITLKRQGRL